MPFRKFKTFKLSVQFYTECEKLSLSKHLKDQLMRASSSISLNIAESSGKRTLKDKRKFIHIAYGPTKECQSILILAGVTDERIINLADHIAASLYKITQGPSP